MALRPSTFVLDYTVGRLNDHRDEMRDKFLPLLHEIPTHEFTTLEVMELRELLLQTQAQIFILDVLVDQLKNEMRPRPLWKRLLRK